MNAFFQELFEYNDHANLQLIELFEQQQQMISDDPVKLFSHVLNAHHVWNSRLSNQLPLLGVWDVHAIETFRSIHESNTRHTMTILSGCDLDATVWYKTSKGDSFTNTKRDILFQVINHSTYHRAQIATQLKQAGIQPPASDFIFYKR